MLRMHYFNYIEQQLNLLSLRIIQRGRINLLDLNIHSENFFADLLNMIFNLNLINMNIIKQNIEGIDLLDETNKVYVQVSSTATKQKIEKSLSKKILKDYPEYNFKFISIAKNASSLKKSTFTNPYMVLFNPPNDIIDIGTLLKVILNMPIANLQMVYNLVKKELGSNIDIVKVTSNLASIINILSKENLNDVGTTVNINSFEIERKIHFNKLKLVTSIINDYKIYNHRLDEIYKEFDKLGSNKSRAVLNKINKIYTVLLLNTHESEDELFLIILDKVMQIIKDSVNYSEIAYEELEMCVGILVVDAFIRCKIFENPEGYTYAITR